MGEHGAAWTRFEAEALRPLKLSAEELLAEDEERTDGDAQATEKLHLRVLPCDRNLFKKLRSHDLEGHFSAYGASYVEWLGEQSANVWFPDADNAARAIMALAAEIPVNPWRRRPLELAPRENRKTKGDKWGGAAARCLVRLAAPVMY